MQTKNASYLANVLKICNDRKAHKAGKIVQAHILRTDQFSNTFLVNRLIELYSKCGHTAAARRLLDVMPLRNIFSYHAVLDSYCKSNDLGNAYHVFDQIPEKDPVSWNMIISLLSRTGPKEKAVEGYYLMRLNGFMSTRFTLASVLSACGSVGDLECGRECHGLAIKIGLSRNSYVGNALLVMYMKTESIADAFAVFKDLPEHNEVSFTAMMEGLVKSGRVYEAFGMFELMHTERIVDSVSLSSILGVCSQSHKLLGRQIHGLFTKLGFERDVHVNNSLLDMYVRLGYMDCAERLFKNMLGVNVVSWNVMVAGYGKQNQTKKAMECVIKMKAFGFEPDEVTYVNLLTNCFKSGDVETGAQIFSRIPFPNLTSWNAILSGYSQNRFYEEAVLLFREMQVKNVRPDRTTFAVILSSCACIGLLEGGKQIHAASLKAELSADLYIASALIGVYSKCGKIELASKTFNELTQYDVVCCNSMLSGLSSNSFHTEAFAFFKQMQVEEILPTEFSYATILNCCSSLSSLTQGREIHCMVVKDGYANDVYVGTALIDMYCKCGDVGGARRFFDTMPFKNTVTWNEMIHGYAQNGCGEDAVDVFEKMIRNGFDPDSVTFVAVLTACSLSGLVDVGLKIFNSMEKEFGLEPFSDHYACVVDSLGRAGRFSEAEGVIDEMPCKDEVIIWEALLGSCRVYGNVNLARRAADEVLRLDPSGSGPYRLLANMYSSLDRWDDVRDVRDVMGDNRVSKEPGYSRV